MNENITLKIDNREVSVPKGTTILEAARSLGIDIPTLCYMNLKDFCIKNAPASCRICVVEVEGRKNLAPSCATKCDDGMVVRTNTIRILNARRTVMELMLSDHPSDCLVCSKSGKCELQAVAIKLGIRKIPFKGEQTAFRVDLSPSIRRDMSKCIYCRRCEMMCNQVQTVGAVGAVNRGFSSSVMPAFDQNLTDSECTFCGQCVAVCPVGALTEVNHTNRLIRDLSNPGKTVIVQTAPAVRAALGEEFGLPAGISVTGKMVAALRQLGFAKVFDTDFAADLTIMEEGTELLGRLNAFLEGDKNVKLPIITSCCPGWVNFFENQFPDLLDRPSSARSPQQMFGAIAKNYWAGKMGIQRKNLIVVSVMPCLAKKFECEREEFKTNGDPDVNYSISTRELASLIKHMNINFLQLPEEEFDAPLGESTGAAVIFGVSGGVMEAALRTAYEIHTGRKLDNVNFSDVRGISNLKEATVDVNGFELKIAVAHSLGTARKLMNELRTGKSSYHAIEVMACPGGCIGGGGQPLHHGDASLLKARTQALYTEDETKHIRKSHENPYIIALYEEYLGKPMSERAHHLLHTCYFNRSKEIIEQ